MSENDSCPEATDGYYFAITEAELQEGDHVIVGVEGREVGVFNIEGSYYAISNYCVHQGGPLCEGKTSGTLTREDGELSYSQENEIISCPWHGWEFDIPSGKHLARPKYRLPTYDVKVIDGDIFVKL